MCTALFYYTCVYIDSLLNSCGYWTLNKYYHYYCYYYFVLYNKLHCTTLFIMFIYISLSLYIETGENKYNN